MAKTFNVNGTCYAEEHYMVDLESRMAQMKALVDSGKYFTVNRGRQYGKTTLLWAFEEYLQEEYAVLSLDFQRMSAASFQDEYAFADAFAANILRLTKGESGRNKGLDAESISALEQAAEQSKGGMDLPKLFDHLSQLCGTARKPVVLMIDEADSASNHSVFLDFLSQLRVLYLSRKRYPVFQSVILAGVYDIRNLKLKIRTDGERRYNSPWNIAADFNVDMNFSVQDIAGMLNCYEQDYQTGMDINEIAELIYEYTGGYPFMVSRICQLMDERLEGKADFLNKSAVWTKKGVLQAVKMMLTAPSTLFDDMVKKLSDFPELKTMLKEILFQGREYSFEGDNPMINLGVMFGFLKNQNQIVMVANRIFETKLYNLFLSEEETKNMDSCTDILDKNQFVKNGHLNMEVVLEKFTEHFREVYGDCTERFLEENGRRYFLLYLRPIINGTGNYYIEAQTRDRKRTDIIVDYNGEQFVIELKIWRGEEYLKRGEKQLFEYLQFYHKEKGYLLSFNFNQRKKVGTKKITFQGKEIFEAVV